MSVLEFAPRLWHNKYSNFWEIQSSMPTTKQATSFSMRDVRFGLFLVCLWLFKCNKQGKRTHTLGVSIHLVVMNKMMHNVQCSEHWSIDNNLPHTAAHCSRVETTTSKRDLFVKPVKCEPCPTQFHWSMQLHRVCTIFKVACQQQNNLIFNESWRFWKHTYCMFTGSYVPQMYMTHNEQNMFLCPVPQFNGLLQTLSKPFN